MDSCLNHKLNLAHQQDRKSLRYFNSGQIEAAVLCHKRASELLLEALKTTQSSRAKESLELQYQYHIKQQDIVPIKYRISQNRKKAKQMEKEVNVIIMAQDENSQPKSQSKQSDELRAKILRKMTENDSLLSFLNNRGEIVEAKMTQSDTQLLNIQEQNRKFPSSVKKENVVEELELNNRELKRMVNLLCEELETVQKERDDLKENVTRLEKQLALVNVNQRKTCQELFSPFCELTPGGDARELPALAPLELPNFDFESMKK